MKNLTNYHLIEVTYHRATNTKGSRVKLYSPRLKETKWISYDYAESDIVVMALNYLAPLSIPIIGQCETAKGYAIIADSVEGLFQSIK